MLPGRQIAAIVAAVLAANCRGAPPEPSSSAGQGSSRGGDAGGAPSPGAGANVPAEVRDFVLDRRPEVPRELGVNFDDKLVLLGYRLSTDHPRAGSTLDITWYWRCTDAVPAGWQLHTRIDDAERPRLEQPGGGPVRQHFALEQWRRGQFVIDRQTVQIPSDWNSPTLRIHLTVVRDGDETRAMRIVGRPDGERTVSLPELAMELPPPELDVPRAPAMVRIDGRLDDAEWSGAARTFGLRDPRSGHPPEDRDSGALAWLMSDPANLYVAFDVIDGDITDTTRTRDDATVSSPPYPFDGVAVVLDPDGHGASLLEIDVTARNRVHDARVIASEHHRRDATWQSDVRTAVAPRRIVADAGSRQPGYVVEMAIPWRTLGTPPAQGSRLRGNVFVFMAGAHHASTDVGTWSVAYGDDWRAPSRLGVLRF